MRRKESGKKISFIFISLVFFVVFAALAWRGWRSYKKRIWDYPGRLNLLESQELLFISFPERRGEVLEIKLPGEAYGVVPGGYGDYKLKDVWALGESEGGRGEEFLERTVSQLLGIPLDGSFTDLTFWDKSKIYFKKRVGRVKKIDLNNLPVFFEEEQADGSKIKKIDPEKVDFYLGEIFWEKSLREENLKIAVFNASLQSGLAQQAARILENIGLLVVETANWEEKVSSCQLKTAQKFKETLTLKRLKRIFSSCEVSFGVIEERFDLTLIVKESI